MQLLLSGFYSNNMATRVGAWMARDGSLFLEEEDAKERDLLAIREEVLSLFKGVKIGFIPVDTACSSLLDNYSIEPK